MRFQSLVQVKPDSQLPDGMGDRRVGAWQPCKVIWFDNLDRATTSRLSTRLP